MSLDLKPVQVRLSEEAYAALKLLADLEDKDLGEKARELLSLMLMGAGHIAKVQAERFVRAVGSGNGGQDPVAHVKTRR